MQGFNDILKILDSALSGAPWFVYLLLGTGVFFTIYLRFPQIRFFGHAFRTVRGHYDKKGTTGDTSHFQALTTALSGTVGTGNIAGVAYAVHLGGPAALFWMLVTAGVGMTTKFVEVTLSHKYREVLPDGSMTGGPMYYMKNARFTCFGQKFNMKPVAIVFALATIIASVGAGNLPQINSISNAVYSSIGLDKWLTGLILAVLLAVVIIGGIKRIATITEKLVPGMAVFYVIGALSVILLNIENVLPGLYAMFSEVFTGSAAVGGFMGATVAFTFQKGVGRGLFSNEAGQGSAPIAHAAARAEEPLSEGMVAILEPFIDTIVICMITGLTLLASGVWHEKQLNVFQEAEVVVLDKLYNQNNPEDEKHISRYLNKQEGLDGKQIVPFTGELIFEDGRMQNNLSIIHARSLAEDILLKDNDGTPYSGTVRVNNGKILDFGEYSLHGKSLIHSAPLTMSAFKRGILGQYGHHLVTISLLLFAFSSAISWSYYGDRATVFLFGPYWVPLYRFLFVGAFFVGSFTDTRVIWTCASVAVALMTIPNLVCILWLRKEMSALILSYGKFFKKTYPTKKHPRFE